MAAKKSKKPSEESQNSSGLPPSDDIYARPEGKGIYDGLDLAGLDDLGEAHHVQKYEPFEGLPSGSLAFDYAIGDGEGWPRGQTSSLTGIYGSGKTTIIMLTAANTIANGGKVVIFNMENRWNVEYAYKSGMGYPGVNYALVSPRTMESCLNHILWFAKNGWDFGVVDSAAGLSPQEEANGEITDSHVMLQGRVFSTFFRSRSHELALSRMALVFTNQYRAKIVMYGDPRQRTGGYALEYYTSVGVDLNKEGGLDYADDATADQKKSKENPIGMVITGKTWKNIIAPPFRPFQLTIGFMDGLKMNMSAEIVDFGGKYGLFKSKGGGNAGSGSQWFYEGVLVGDNRKAAMETLNQDADMRLECIAQIRKLMRSGS